MTQDVLGSWPVGGTILNESLHLIEVVRRHCLGVRQVSRDGQRHTKLVELQVRVRRDDCSRREVDSFAHEIASQATFFAFEPCSDGSQRLSRLMFLLRLTTNVIVHESRHEVLQNVAYLVQGRSIRTFLNLQAKLVVHL